MKRENVEFKAELRDVGVARGICEKIGARHVWTREQTDTYFRVASGRLKRRETMGWPAEIIRYDRPNRVDAAISSYEILTDDEARTRYGHEDPPVWLIVRKMRELYLLAGIRIHLDDVDQLGTFLEFEAVVSPALTPEQGRERVMQLRQDFAPVLGEPISTSYSDMLSSTNEQ